MKQMTRELHAEARIKEARDRDRDREREREKGGGESAALCACVRGAEIKIRTDAP